MRQPGLDIACAAEKKMREGKRNEKETVQVLNQCTQNVVSTSSIRISQVNTIHESHEFFSRHQVQYW